MGTRDWSEGCQPRGSRWTEQALTPGFLGVPQTWETLAPPTATPLPIPGKAVAVPERKIGLFSFLALSKASCPQGYLGQAVGGGHCSLARV